MANKCIVCGQPAVNRTRCAEHIGDYLPAGPTIEAFHNDFRFVKLIIGSFGSAKSTACCFDLFFNAQLQKKQQDGKRRSRYAVVRESYRELEDSTLRTFKQWFGRFGDFKVSSNTFFLKYGPVEAEFLFRALDRPDDVEKLFSTEYTKAWVNEARSIPRAILDGLTGRVGRYPSEAEGGCVDPGVIMDTNPPDDDHWIYKLFEVELHKNPQIQEEYVVFKQPPGAVLVAGKWEDNVGQVKGIPKAENIDNLAPGYYRRMCIGKDREWIKVYAEGKYGFVQTGKPVFPQYSDAVHCQEFKADPGLELLLGFDAGLTPACVIAQLSKRGQLRILDELVAQNMDSYTLARDVLKPHLAKYYPGYRYHDTAWGDPAKTRGDAASHSAIGILNDAYSEDGDSCQQGIVVQPLHLPFMTIPAPGDNSLAPRISAVNFYLTKLIDGAPGFLLHPRCTLLRKGFLGKYRLERIQVSGSDERYKEIPQKNAASHPHDALQNIALGTLGITQQEAEPEEYYVPTSAFSGR